MVSSGQLPVFALLPPSTVCTACYLPWHTAQLPRPCFPLAGCCLLWGSPSLPRLIV